MKGSMKRKTAHVSTDLESLTEDARALIAATADVAGDKVAEARKRLSAALDDGQEVWGRFREKADEGIEAADEMIREHPYGAMGVALGVGALFGFLLTRRN